MVEIPLRSYLHEIEKHIEGGRTDQAIAHSRYILQSYPKYVDVYRLLGKAYLESQQYGEAGDIFQRVLSSVPDDFIANVGMSLIREDEGNIDEAIWHLERAFEIQPSNGAVQDELRRLYGRRDNVEPPKIRLTRGALARMYFKGELYQQAISEIRVALGENPNRFDLQALLAEIYMRTNQTVEAADTAMAVLRRLPNCLIANRVMLQVLAGSDRESERKSYQQRLSQLDPYSAFTTPDNPEAEAVPEQRIKLEKLDWKPEAGGLESASQPVWAASLGVDLEDLAPQQGKDVLPEWLTEVSPAAEEMDETIDEQLYASPLQGEESEQASVAAEKDEEEIPDWLREAGWESATGESRAAEAAFQFESNPELEPAEDKLVAAEIPDWLKAMVPPSEPEETVEEEDVTPWLEKLMPSVAISSVEPPPDESTVIQEPEAKLPDWLVMAGAAGAVAIGADRLDRQDEETGVESLAESELYEPAEPIPDWLSDLQTAAAELGSEEPESQPPVAPDVGLLGAHPAAIGLVASEIPDWLTKEETSAEKPMGEEGPMGEEEPMVEEEPSEEELPDWLLQMYAANSGLPDFSIAEAETGPVEEELPDWLLEADTEAVTSPAEGRSEASEELEAVESASELPDWLREIESSTQAGEGAPEISAESEPTELPSTELPDWLLEAEPVEGELPDWLLESELVEGKLSETPVEEEALESAPAELPDWLKEIKPVEEMEATTAEVEPASEVPEWLKTVQSTPLEELPTEALADTQPIRVKPVSEPAPFEFTPPQPVQESVEAPEEQEELESAFAWLLGLGMVSQAVQPAEAEELEAAEEAAVAPIVLLEPVEKEVEFVEEEREALESEQPVETLEFLEDEKTFLETEAPEQAAETLEGEEILLETETEGEPAMPEAGEEEPFPDQEAAFAWLESLAVKRGAEEAPASKPEEGTDEIPEWLRQVALASGAKLALESQELPEEGPQEVPPASEVALPILEELPAEEIPPFEMAAEAGEAAVEERPQPEAVSPEAAPEEEAVEAIPPLPEWLTEPAVPPGEEQEWTPPPLTEQIITPAPESELSSVKPAVVPEESGIAPDLAEARQQLAEGQLLPALSKYNRMIEANQDLERIIQDLQEASSTFPEQSGVWQELGDAYLRTGQIQEALRAYIKAEELL